MSVVRKALIFAAALLPLAQAQPGGDAKTPGEMARSVLTEIISINTTDSEGDNTRAAEAMARRLRDAGFAEGDVHVVVPAAKKGNVVARLRGAGRGKPVLFIAHLDVVEAKRSDWTMDPFTLTEKDGYFYGRGTQDIKGDASLLVANFIRLKRENFKPNRDLILALTADEEGGRGPNGIRWLLENRRPFNRRRVLREPRRRRRTHEEMESGCSTRYKPPRRALQLSSSPPGMWADTAPVRFPTMLYIIWRMHCSRFASFASRSG